MKFRAKNTFCIIFDYIISPQARISIIFSHIIITATNRVHHLLIFLVEIVGYIELVQIMQSKSGYAMRSGVEATMSEYDRLTGVKHLRIRGLNKVRFCAILKGIGINIFRAVRVKKARTKQPPENRPVWSETILLAGVLKALAALERIDHYVLSWIAILSTLLQHNYPRRRFLPYMTESDRI